MAKQATTKTSKTAKPKAGSSAKAKSKRKPASDQTVGTGDHVYLIDGSTYIFRAFFAMFKASQARGRSFSRSDGTPTGAVMTFCNMLWKIVRDGIDDGSPTRIGVIFDPKGGTFRNDIYPEYKANRDEPPEELVPQFPLIRDAVRAFNLTPIEQKGFEADDLIATYARLASEAGANVTIVSGDKDLMQLVSERVAMFDPMPGNERRIGEAEVIAKFGVGPGKVVEVQSLAGDSTDNVPGVPGIGIKTAAQLIEEFGDLESLLDKAETIKQNKRRENLIEFADQARISKELVKLRDDVEVDLSLDQLDVPDVNGAKLVAFCKAMEFRTFTNRVAETYDVDAEAVEADAKLAAGPSKTGPGKKSKADAKADGAPDAYKPELAVKHGAELATETPIDTSAYASVTTLDDLNAWIDEAIELGRCAFDTETDSLDALQANLIGFSLATEPGRACYVPLAHGRSNGLDLEGTGDIEQIPIDDALKALTRLLEHPGVLKIGQNIKYDLHVMRAHGVNIAPFDDTLLLSFALDAGKGGHGMDELSGRWLGTPPDFVQGGRRHRQGPGHVRSGPPRQGHSLCRRGCRRDAETLAYAQASPRRRTARNGL